MKSFLHTIALPNKNFSLRQTLECGQVFRFSKQADGYMVFSQDKACFLQEDNQFVTMQTNDIEYFKNYFDLGTDYGEIINKLKCFAELDAPLQFGSGIRILNQSLLETVISFIISANNNIPRIKGIIERLCKACATDMNGYFAFPTLEQLLTLSKADFAALGCGFRADYLYTTTRQIADGALQNIKFLSTEDAQAALVKLKGVGAKVANCIMLFGLKKLDSYPVDTWIFKANSSPTLDTPQKVQQYYSSRYGSFAGYAQQYIFYHARETAIKQVK